MTDLINNTSFMSDFTQADSIRLLNVYQHVLSEKAFKDLSEAVIESWHTNHVSKLQQSRYVNETLMLQRLLIDHYQTIYARDLSQAVSDRDVDKFILSIKKVVEGVACQYNLNVDFSNPSLWNNLTDRRQLYWALWDRIENRYDTQVPEYDIHPSILEVIKNVSDVLMMRSYSRYPRMADIISDNLKALVSEMSWCDPDVIILILESYSEGYDNDLYQLRDLIEE